ncbi:MAG: hypothetical protein LBB67_06185 [Oscillospiraceae bacterium]|jgi:hypothetical protein|nr:hypothetical protein [Oscillospiraceae bacterium]
MTESVRLLKRFALTSLILLCAAVMLCGGLIVDENTRKLAFGTEGREVGMQLDKQTTTLFVDKKAIALPPLETIADGIRCAPAPIGSVAALGFALKNAIQVTIDNIAV